MGRPRSFTEDDVVSIARGQFWENGYAGTSLDDLTAATGLSRGSLYAAFGDKHGLFVRAMDSYCEGSLGRAVNDLRGPSATTPYQGLVNHVRNMEHVYLTGNRQRGCMMAKAAAELAPADATVTKTLKRALDSYRRLLTATIRAAQNDGDIDPEADADALAALMLAVLRGMEALRKLGAGRAVLSAAADQLISSLPRPA
ncbi:TetR/AcrR family transcriptional regulator [Mycolicibacterium sp. 018/SC-01/001]|uniref:TetR/AcrR family transcriptional regulator n=1 Tax=Mycolicibacterium sp. 018/SC-01/001 TaxID=2592069 RepID=UPI00117F7468|nr:TetR/AcrR family transcriptional regulator [Mycolicibacterium sp. 018/SC-01/001]TRW89151.1 TetR/AcrR family transcriptional regulator [Mycolicibacterium sp. 018/SC-01/001]